MPPWPRRNDRWDSEYVVTALHNKVLTVCDSNTNTSPCYWKTVGDSLVASNSSSDYLRDIFIINQSSSYYDVWINDEKANVPLTGSIVYIKNSKYSLSCQMLSTVRVKLRDAAQTLTNWDILPAICQSMIMRHAVYGYAYRIQV